MGKKIPKSWTSVKLNQLGEVISGSGFPKKYQGKTEGKYPFFKVGDISKAFVNNDVYSENSENYVDEEEVKLIKGKVLPANSVVFAKIGEALKLNRRIILSKDSLVDNNALGIKTNEDIYLHKLLYYFLKNFNLAELSSGNTVPSVRKGVIEEIEIPHPTLAEQERIVAKLDDLFGRLDKIKASLSKIPQLLQNFRQQVLTQAVTGKLTKEWREEKSNWNKATIKELSQKIFDGPFGSKLKTADYTSSGIQVVRLENIKRLSFDTSKQSFISREKYEELKGNTLKKGDIIFASFVGDEVRATLLPELNTPAINKADCFCIRLDQEKIDKHFCVYVLLSNEGKDQITKLAHGITRPRINLTQLRSINIPLPSLKEQQEIVNRVESLFNKADIIQDKYEFLKAKVEQLPQAILHKAFKGELVPQLDSDGDAMEVLRQIEGLKAESLLKKASGRRKAIKDFGKEYTLDQENQLKVAEEKETYKE